MGYRGSIYSFCMIISTAAFFLLFGFASHQPISPRSAEAAPRPPVTTLESKPDWLLLVGSDIPVADVEAEETKVGPVGRNYHPRRPPIPFAWKATGWFIGTDVLEYFGIGPGECGLTVTQQNKQFNFLLKSYDPKDFLIMRIWSDGKIIYWKGKGEIINLDLGQRIVLPLSTGRDVDTVKGSKFTREQERCLDSSLIKTFPAWLKKGQLTDPQRGARHYVGDTDNFVNFMGYNLMSDGPELFIEAGEDYLIYLGGRGIIVGRDGTKVLVGYECK